jgi:hypothetical protein
MVPDIGRYNPYYGANPEVVPSAGHYLSRSCQVLQVCRCRRGVVTRAEPTYLTFGKVVSTLPMPARAKLVPATSATTTSLSSWTEER